MFLVIDLMKSLILIQSFSYFLISSLLSLLGTSVKYLFPFVSIGVSENKVQTISTINFYVFFDCHIFNIVNKKIFVCLFIYFNIIWIKTFYIDNVIKKVVYSDFYINIFDFITDFYNAFINIKLILIHYLCSEILITVLLDILSNNRYYSH